MKKNYEDIKLNEKKLIHPGEILLNDFMKPNNMSQNALANALKVPPRRINEIVNKKRSITPDSALRLSRYFNNKAEFWLKLQYEYELVLTKAKMGDKIDKEIEVCKTLKTQIKEKQCNKTKSYM